MAKLVPEQLRYIDPATQQVLQYDTDLTEYFLSRTNNLTLNSIGHDLVLSGFNIENPLTDITFTGNSISVKLTNGWLIKDYTVIQTTDPDVTITFNDADNPLYAATGKFIIHCNFLFLETPQVETQMELRMSWIDAQTATTVLPYGWDYKSDGLILHSFDFTKDGGGNITSVTWNNEPFNASQWPINILAFGPFYMKGQWFELMDQTNTTIHLWEIIKFVHDYFGAGPHNLDFHDDVTITSPVNDDHILQYDSGMWVNKLHDLNIHDDVTITSPINRGDSLLYDPDTEQWINANSSPSITALANMDSTTTANDGEVYVTGVDNSGGSPLAIEEDPYVIYNGERITIPRTIVYTDRIGAKGFIVYDSTGSNKFTMFGTTPYGMVLARPKLGNDNIGDNKYYWEYDNNHVSGWQQFTPTNTDIIIGVIKTDDSIGDLVTFAEAYSYAFSVRSTENPIQRLNELIDVDIQSSTTGSMLFWNNTTKTWESQAVDMETFPFSHNLNQHTGVTLSGVSRNDTLTYNGSNWVNHVPIAGPSIRAKINYISFSSSNPGEVFLHGVDSDGAPANVEGYFVFNGAIYVPTGASGDNVVYTSKGPAEGYVIFDTTLGGKFNVVGNTDSNIAFTRPTGLLDTWEYDDNGGGWQPFVLADTDVIIGTLRTDGIDSVERCEVWSHAVSAKSFDVLGPSGYRLLGISEYTSNSSYLYIANGLDLGSSDAMTLSYDQNYYIEFSTSFTGANSIVNLEINKYTNIGDIGYGVSADYDDFPRTLVVANADNDGDYFNLTNWSITSPSAYPVLIGSAINGHFWIRPTPYPGVVTQRDIWADGVTTYWTTGNYFATTRWSGYFDDLDTNTALGFKIRFTKSGGASFYSTSSARSYVKVFASKIGQ